MKMTNHEKSVVRHAGPNSALDVASSAASVISPAADILETPEAYLLMLDMPGMAKEGIGVAMDGESLTVRGSTGTVQNKDADLVFSEIRSGTYLREFTLGKDIEREEIEATYEHGVLTLRLPKKESLKPREIRVR
jgi:HSP20 family protein